MAEQISKDDCITLSSIAPLSVGHILTTGTDNQYLQSVLRVICQSEERVGIDDIKGKVNLVYPHHIRTADGSLVSNGDLVANYPEHWSGCGESEFSSLPYSELPQNPKFLQKLMPRRKDFQQFSPN